MHAMARRYSESKLRAERRRRRLRAGGRKVPGPEGWNQRRRSKGGIRGPGANRRPLRRAGPHRHRRVRPRPFLFSFSWNIAVKGPNSISRVPRVLAWVLASCIDSPGSIVIRDPADNRIAWRKVGQDERAGDLGGSRTWISIAITRTQLKSILNVWKCQDSARQSRRAI